MKVERSNDNIVTIVPWTDNLGQLLQLRKDVEDFVLYRGRETVRQQRYKRVDTGEISRRSREKTLGTR